MNFYLDNSEYLYPLNFILSTDFRWWGIRCRGKGYLSLKVGRMYVSIFFIITCVPFLYFMKK